MAAPSDLFVKLISLLLDRSENLPLTYPPFPLSQNPLLSSYFGLGWGTYGEQISPIGRLANEAFINSDQLVPEMEQLFPVEVDEDIAAGDEHGF